MRVFISVCLFLSSFSASAATLHCGGLWAGVESIMNVSATVALIPDGSPSPISLVVNNAEFHGSMMATRNGEYQFSVRRVGSSELILSGSMRFLTTVSDPTKTGFLLHTSEGRVEAILTCDAGK